MGALIFFRLRLYYLAFALLLPFSNCSKDTTVEKSYWLPDVQHFLADEDTAALHFMFISDWGFNGSDNQQSVAREMANVSETSGLDFILTCGDNFQVAGVKTSEDLLWSTNYEQVYNDSALMVSWYPALGNHDYMGVVDAQVEYSAMNPAWKMPAKYYTFIKEVDSVNSIRFIVLDTPGLLADYNELSSETAHVYLPQYSWLENTLKNNTQKWTIVTGHHPVYSSSSFHGDTKVLKNIIKPLFEKYAVDFYICGHDHDFEHAHEEGEFTNYIVTGTGGEVRDAGSNSRTIFSLSSLGFTYASLTSSSLRLYFITPEGKIAYNYVLNK